jgi:hypothetical protein
LTVQIRSTTPSRACWTSSGGRAAERHRRINFDLHAAAGIFLDLLGPRLEHVRLCRRLGAKQMVQLEGKFLGRCPARARYCDGCAE